MMAAPESSIPLLCAISGQTPIDPVVTPSGRICSRGLLLSKLTDTNGIDPFDPSKARTLDESELISLSTDLSNTDDAVPPRPPTAASFPSILSLLQKEYDGLLLELFDTRRALEETRRELSQALYQNDAAVRVVARLASERDAARDMLAQWTAKAAENTAENTAEVGQKRRRVDADADADVDADEEVGPKPPPALVEPEPSSSSTTPNTIPPSDLEALKAKWKTLSKSRRKRPPPPPTHLTKDKLAHFTSLDKKTLHKSSAKPGITALVLDRKNDMAVTAGRDKHLIVYSRQDNRVLANVSNGTTKEITSMDIHTLEDGTTIIVTGSEDGCVRAYISPDYTLLGNIMIETETEKDEQNAIVGVSIHPTGTYALATTKKGTVAFLSVSSEKKEDAIQKRAVFSEKDAENVQYSCSTLHPDGLILGVGTTDGKFKVWDLKTQQLAQTLEGHGGLVTSLSFSENGYHVASSSSSGEVLVWDLRKGKTIKTLNKDDDDDDNNNNNTTIGAVHDVAFDPSGKYLAYGGEKGAKITVVKEWNFTASLFELDGGDDKKDSTAAVTGISWGKDAMSLVTCSEKERAMRYWGPAADAAAEGDDVKMEES